MDQQVVRMGSDHGWMSAGFLFLFLLGTGEGYTFSSLYYFLNVKKECMYTCVNHTHKQQTKQFECVFVSTGVLIFCSFVSTGGVLIFCSFVSTGGVLIFCSFVSTGVLIFCSFVSTVGGCHGADNSLHCKNLTTPKSQNVCVFVLTGGVGCHEPDETGDARKQCASLLTGLPGSLQF